MNREGTPPAAVFDPAAEEVPPVLQEILKRSDLHVVLLVAADAEGPAQDMAVRMAEERGRLQLGTILADADLDAPRLHAHVGLPNHEGLTDLFLFGASVNRVALTPEGERFRFIPAGPYAPDPAEVLESTRWDHIASEMSEADTMLLVFAPAGAPGLGTVSGRADGAIIMAPPGAVDRVTNRLAPNCTVLAALTAPGPDTAPSGAAEAEPGEGADTAAPAPGSTLVGGAAAAAATAGAVGAAGTAGAEPRQGEPADSPASPGQESEAGEDETVVGDGGAVDDQALASGAGAEGAGQPHDEAATAEGATAPAASPEAESDLTEPHVTRKEPDDRRHFPIVLIVLLVALLAGWFGYQHFFAPALIQEPVEPEVVEAPPAERGDPVETPLPYSVAVEAHQDLASALERVRRLNETDSDATFYLAPVTVNGGLFYRLLAGPATDRESATTLMEELVASGHKTAVDEWAVLPTSHAFLLGEFHTLEEAEARVDSLTGLGVPVYRLPLRYEGGQLGYRVYGGAYTSETEAAVMRGLLEEAGVEGELVTRTGDAAGTGGAARSGDPSRPGDAAGTDDADS